MNRIKRISSIILAIVLSLGIAFRLDISHVFAEKENNVGKQVTAPLTAEEEAKTITVSDTDKVIYMDLAAGSVTISSTNYTGYIFVEGEPQAVQGTHNKDNKYYVYQSNTTNINSACYKTKTGYVSSTEWTNKTNFKIPQYPRVTYSGDSGTKTWSKYITNNTKVKQVSMDWDIYAPNSGRDATNNNITFGSQSGYIANVTIDNIWSTYVDPQLEGRTSGGIGANLRNKNLICKNTHISLQLKGDNRVACVHYSAGTGDKNTIEFNDGEKTGAEGSITVGDYKTNFSGNHWCSVIGAADNPPSNGDMSDGIVINSGVIYAGATPADNCTAIGGGGNNYGGVTIKGGKVTAVTAGTGTAIGGGIGYGDKGGNAKVTITGGIIYAYNLGLVKGANPKDSFAKFVPAAAIGGGGSNKAAASLEVNIEITGGEIYAQSMGGTAIGGGCSANAAGGPAIINISGGTIIAKSTAGKFGTDDVSAGVSIGGGTGATGGGSVELNIHGGILRTGSIGGGGTTGSGTIGSANVTITDGDIVGQVVMAGGAEKACKFTMSGGKIHDVDLINGNKITDLTDPQPDIPILYQEKYKDGGAVWMDDTNGVTEITGGTIEKCSAENGGAVYMTGGTFTISGAGVINNNKASKDGGGIYLGGGTVKVTGGYIKNNTAKGNGGGAYIAGNFSMTNGEIILNNAVNGGGAYVNDGTVTMYGGKVDSNTATESGGGMYISSTKNPALVDIFSGSISSNKAKSGGGVSVVSDSEQPINVTVGVNCVHPDLKTDGTYTPFAYADDCGEAHNEHTNHISGLSHSSCPEVKNNNASGNGGGFFLKSAQTNLIFYCVIEEGNVANGKLQCYNMDVLGGKVEIGDSTYEHGTSETVKGNIVMKDSIMVEGGTVDIYGTMDNPRFTKDITVDIEKETDHYIDHREVNNATTDVKHYKVHYYENFKGNGNTPTGLYVARDYPDDDHKGETGNEKYDFTVMSSIFSRPGYKIVGWNSNPNATEAEYEVNHTYNLATLDNNGKVGAKNSAGVKDNSLLVLYAIWEFSGYVIEFNPNVGDGQTYTGTMPNQVVTFGTLNDTINKNQFKRSGYKFLGWTLTPTPTDTVKYTDGQEIIEDFATEDGTVVVLYAQWSVCDHKTSLTYVANGNILTQGCSNCSTHSAMATISALNSVYDGENHLATVKYSSSWLGSKELIISYTMAANTEWDSKDTIDDNWTENSVPLHAGTYTASITVGGATAKIQYVISQVQWATPAVPVVEFSVSNGQNVITINPIQDTLIMYGYERLDDPNFQSIEWQTSNEFVGIELGYYYHFYAKKVADRNHTESEHSKSSAYLATGGNIVRINSDIGIKVISSTGTGAFVYTVGADTGYHLRDYKDNSATAVSEVKPVEGANANLGINGITIAKEELTDGTYKYTVTFSTDTSYQVLTLEFKGVAKNASVDYKVTDGQVFSDFNGGDITISRDSAFTAQFTVSDYIPDEYTKQVLNFSKGLPLGTTIILKYNGDYWYYKLVASVTAIDLTEFIAMGKSNELFTVNTTDTTAITFIYQFIVDFSKSENTMTDSLQVTLGLVANTAKTGVPSIPAEGATHISLEIKEEAKFALEVASVNGDSATLKGSYTQSLGEASIWDSRNTALVLTATSDPSATYSLPVDAKITAVVNGATTRYTMNSGNKFIIPMGEIETKEINLTLSSSLFTSTAQNFAFTAEWYVSESSVDNSPLNGKKVANCNVSFTCKKDTVPSVKINGEKHVCKPSEELTVTVNFKGIPSGETTITAYLQGKTEGKYVDTGAKIDIKDLTVDSKTIKFNMGQMNKGSYRILVIVQNSGANILEVPYYFVIV